LLCVSFICLPILTFRHSAGFWYGTYCIGDAAELSLLIDTGSDDVLVNPGVYKPSADSLNLHQKGDIAYATAQANGCGFANMTYNIYADRIDVSGLTADNQTFGNVLKRPQPDPE
jgi:hypothetical protein